MILRAMTVLLFAACGPTVARAQEAPMTPQAYDALFAVVNNAGRWGKDDALGTPNHVTTELRVAAAREICTGTSVSLSRVLEPGRGSRRRAASWWPRTGWPSLREGDCRRQSRRPACHRCAAPGVGSRASVAVRCMRRPGRMRTLCVRR